MSQTAPTQARTGNRRHRGILALLVALACLAGCTTGELKTSPSGPVTSPSGPVTSPSGTVTPRAGTATPSQEQMGAVSWPADGVSAADISGIGVTDGPGATQQVPIASVAKLMTAYVILPDHPLPGGGSGPDIPWNQRDIAAVKARLAADADHARDQAADALSLVSDLPRRLGGEGLWLAVAVVPEYRSADPAKTTPDAASGS
ncbi:MAG: D-alanyl-D-alanine carboxypeptidase [Actinomycetia bacterium]|nr:D-alanyl-D-alanine carboxypeptidase [Actinomycetes bacterium]